MRGGIVESRSSITRVMSSRLEQLKAAVAEESVSHKLSLCAGSQAASGIEWD